MHTGKRVLVGVVLSAAAGASTVSCATSPAATAQIPGSAGGGVAAICQNVMGLSPTERLRGGNWLGNDKLDYRTSHYRGCLVSLADSLQGARDTEVVQQAEERCRARGLLPGTPDLALCVLQTANAHPEPTATASSEPAASTRADSAGATTTAAEQTRTDLVAAGSYYFASPHEIVRRETVACAALGLSPARPEFKSCVQQLNATFYSIDHPID